MLADEISEIDIARTAIDTNATAEQHVGVVKLVDIGPVHYLPRFELIFMSDVHQQRALHHVVTPLLFIICMV